MKLIDMKCPHCAANLQVDSEKGQATCKYCGATILIDNEIQHIQYDNAEEAGYKFEKGRQKAQAEARRAKSQSNIQQYRQQPKKKRRTWLWVIGWILIFPLPLTILILRKKDMKPTIKYGIIAVGWILYLIIAIAGGSGNSDKESKESASSSITTTSTQTTSKTSPTTSTQTQTTLAEEPMDEMTALQSFYDDFSKNGTLKNLKDMVAKYGLFTDSRKDGIGHETYKVAFSRELAKVISNSDLSTPGNYIVIKINLLNNNSVDSITFHSDSDVVAQANTSAKTTSEKTITYAEDDVVNRFIAKYNEITQSEFTDIQKGNIRTKYFASSYGYYCELLNANDTHNICVTINETNDNADIGVLGMRDIFHDVAISIDPSLTDDEVYTYFDELIASESMKEGDTLGKMTILYVPDKELSSGHSRGHIEIAAH